MKLAVALVSIAVAVGPARADPAAEKLFRDGQALMQQGQTEAACDRFARSQKLEPRVGTSLNLGSCLELLGKTASAWEAFMTAKSLATTAGEKGRAAHAGRRAAALQPQLAYLTIIVAADVSDGLEIARNGVTVDRAVWNIAVPVDPGEHTVVARSPGHEDWTGTRSIGVGAQVTITVDPIALTAPAAVETTPPPETATGTPAPRPVDPAAALAAAAVPRSPAPRRWAIGVAAGESVYLDPTFRVRVFRDVPLSKGAIRAIASATYDNFNDDHTNGFMRSHQVLFGGAVEYTWSASKVRFAVGATIGLDLLFRNTDRGIDAAPWWGIQVSPVIVRALDTLEIGLHLQGIQSTDRFAAFGLVAADWYVR